MTIKTSQKTSARLEARISQETKALVQKAADLVSSSGLSQLK